MKGLINLTLIIAILILTAVACKEDGTDDPVVVSEGSQFNIAFDQEASIKNENLILKFTEIKEDSRCPVDVECVWEGRLSIVIKANAQDLELSIGGQSEPIGVIEGYKITLVEVVEPTPKSNVDPEDSDYIVALLVEKV